MNNKIEQYMNDKGKINFILVVTLLIVFLVFTLSNIASAEELTYGNIERESSVTSIMTNSSFWSSNARDDVNKIMLTKEQVSELNEKIILAKETCMHDLKNTPSNYDALSIRKALEKTEIPTKDLYINGYKIDNKEYFKSLITAIKNTGYSSNRKTIQYAICIKNTNQKAWPTNDIIGYSKDDSDDEMQSSSLCVNEPFVIKQRCKIDNKTFYWGETMSCTGWVDGDDIAICNSKDEWLDAWMVDISNENFLVVTQDKIVIEPSIIIPEVSNVSLTLGTILKLVPESEIPKEIGKRGRWHNYVVYLPIRNEYGKYEKRLALIPERYSVSKGFLNLSEKNILDVALRCLGNRYGWGGMLNAMDCSLFLKKVYRCFGFELPRNTTLQQKVPYKYVDMSKLNDEEKKEILDIMPVGCALYFPGHAMIYLGKYNDNYYVISATSGLSDSINEVSSVITINSVVINPLTVKRANNTTWLSNINGALCLSNCVDFVKEKVNEKIEDKIK